MSDPFFSLVVLCYRGGQSVIPYVEKLHEVLAKCNFAWEMVLVGNYLEGSEDPTPVVVARLASRWPNVRSIAVPKKGMMGWDVRLGMAQAHGVYIGFVDGDGQIPPESVVACLAKAEAENLDLVKTYRIRRDDGLYRKLVSGIYNAFFRLLFGSTVRDVNSKPKIIRRDKYEHLKLQSDDWFIDAEIILRAGEMRLRTGEIPIHFSANEHRASFVKPVAILQFITNMLRYRLKRFG